ncbi:hypothetical protein FB107DRAFT_207774 [Schizophyllum commune]
MYALDRSDVSLHAYLPRSPQWKSNPSRDSINRRMLDDIRRHSVRVRRALLAADYDAWSSAAKELVYTVLRLAEWENAWAAEDGVVDYSQAVARLTRIREEWMSRVSAKSFADANTQLGRGSEASDADAESHRARSPVAQEQRQRHASHSRWPAHDDDAGTPWVEPRRHEPRDSDPRTTTGGVQGGMGTEQPAASFTPPSPPRSARSASTASPGSSSATPTDTGVDRSTRRRGRHARRSSQPAGAPGESSQDAVALMNVVRDLTERLRSPSSVSSRASSDGPPLSNTLQDLSRVLNQLNDVSAHQGRPKRSRKRHDRAASQQ